MGDCVLTVFKISNSTFQDGLHLTMVEHKFDWLKEKKKKINELRIKNKNYLYDAV